MNRFLSKLSFLVIGFVLMTSVAARGGEKRPLRQAQDRPNILFILTDDHRWDAMGFTGVYPFLKTPNMDRLRAEGAYMKNAYVTLSMCAPSRASFLTGMYPHKHGVSNNESHRECDWMKTPAFRKLSLNKHINTRIQHNVPVFGPIPLLS